MHSYFITGEQFERFKPLKQLSNITSYERTWILLYAAGFMVWRVDIKEMLSGCQIQIMIQEER